MSRRRILREPRLHAAVGAMVLAGPASVALADAPHGGSAHSDGSQSPSQPGTSFQAHLRSHRLRYGQALVVDGRAPAQGGGQTVALDFAPSGSSTWQQIASTPVAANGGFRFWVPLRGSGQVKVTTAQPTLSTLAIVAAAASSSGTTPQRVAVQAGIRLRRRVRTVFGAGTVQLHGLLLPRSPGRRLALQARRGGRWVTVTSTRTRGNGGFDFRYHLGAPGQQPLRVRFAGDAGNAGATASAGQVAVLQPTVASWYDDGGTTACGFHAYYGVANLSLPCGSRVTLSAGGRTVTATVDDRGPYVGGREWDLNQNTAAALGFGGVGTVWSSS
ncbi:MAG: hypothetical protein JO244_06665 [Solirubrobacterales bacterium]|nr:hypothetical protein [Solirubrobacterales bacterium]